MAGPALSEAWCQVVPAQEQRTSLCQTQESGLAGASREEKGKEAGAPADKAGTGRGKGMKGNQKEQSP